MLKEQGNEQNLEVRNLSFTLRGITVSINGDTTGLDKDLSGINSKISDCESLSKRILDFEHEIQNLGSFINGYTELISKFPDFQIISNLKEN